MSRKDDSGVSLLNVLVVVAAASGLVQVMLAGQQEAVSEISRSQDLAQAAALARSGVTSVAVALRRDMQTDPQTDHPQEPWGLAAQDPVRLDFGEFDIAIEDVRGRYNLNTLAAGAFLEARRFAALLAGLDLPETLAPVVQRAVVDQGPLERLETLLDFGLSEADLARLRPHVTVAPSTGSINLNAATPQVLAALFANPAAAQSLVVRRSARGFLTQEDLSALGLAVPSGSGFTSDAFDVRVGAQVGAARVTLDRRLIRDPEAQAVRIISKP